MSTSKKLAFAAFALVITLGLSACSGNGDNGPAVLGTPAAIQTTTLTPDPGGVQLIVAPTPEPGPLGVEWEDGCHYQGTIYPRNASVWIHSFQYYCGRNQQIPHQKYMWISIQ